MNERYYFGKTFLRGFAIGTSDIVPGVSGGTMAVVLGIYRNLVDALKSFNWVWLKAVLLTRQGRRDCDHLRQTEAGVHNRF